MRGIPYSKVKKTDAHWLYVLRDPFERIIKYVGVTTNLKDRKRQHLTEIGDLSFSRSPQLKTWINSLKSRKSYPLFEVIKKYNNYKEAHKMEVKLIKELSEHLLNRNSKGTENG